MLTGNFHPNISDPGESRGPAVSRNYEKDRDAFARPVFGRRFRLVLRGDNFQFRRFGDQRAGFGKSVPGWGHDHAANGNIYVVNHGNDL